MTTVMLPTGVELERLLHLYEKQKQQLEKRAEFYKTEEGKAYNRQKMKSYYDRNRDKVLQKARERYQKRKESTLASENREQISGAK